MQFELLSVDPWLYKSYQWLHFYIGLARCPSGMTSQQCHTLLPGDNLSRPAFPTSPPNSGASLFFNLNPGLMCLSAGRIQDTDLPFQPDFNPVCNFQCKDSFLSSFPNPDERRDFIAVDCPLPLALLTLVR